MKLTLTLISIFFTSLVFSQQDYTLYQTGSETDVETTPSFGLVLMGGATESDNAMRWFLDRANGGDVVVIRTSGSDGYNNYLYSELGIEVNSVRTIVFENAAASEDPDVIEMLENAEAIWLAGGNQWTYYDFWNESAVEETLIDHIENGGVIGGTSAGMAVLGGIDYVAQFASVTSDEALNNPFSTNITLEDDFVTPPFMDGVITDTHYDNPDRKGRHVAFLAHAMAAFQVYPKGIASEEYTAVCVNDEGLARVFGEYPEYEDYAYFIRLRCETPNEPEVAVGDMPLIWNLGGDALKVYKVPGTLEGDYSFNLTDWVTGTGGEWQNWWVVEGELNIEENTEEPGCPVGIDERISETAKLEIYPNPAIENVTVKASEKSEFQIYSLHGKILKTGKLLPGENLLDLSGLSSGVYFLKSTESSQVIVIR
ncbi:T9SS type A sorting domain-containing protein [Halocola ammonii]